MSVSERIKELRGRMSRKAFEQLTGINQQTIYDYENNRAKPSFASLKKFSENLGINEDWLMTGQGQKYKSQPQESVIMQHNHHSNANSITVGAQMEEKLENPHGKCPQCLELEEKLRASEEERRKLTEELLRVNKEYTDYLRAQLADKK